MPKSWYEDPKIPLEKNRYCFARVMWSSCNGHETHILKLTILPVLLDVDFTCNLFHCGLVSVCRFTVFLALLGNHCYSFHRTKWRLVTSICRGPGPVAKKCRFFRRNSNPLQIFQLQPKKETSSSSLGDRLEKKSIISPSNRAICAGLRGKSGFRAVPVTTVALTKVSNFKCKLVARVAWWGEEPS